MARKKSAATIVTDPPETAKAAHLRYVNDDEVGIQRERHGKNFIYRDTRGRKITDAKILDRIKALHIPPAWEDVWICPSPNGHIQATGRDSKGRKQYRYHPRWREVRNENNFGRMVNFGEHLPQIRERVEHDLSSRGLSHEKVLALVVRLLEMTLIRVGNEEYTHENKSYGLTTLRDKHVDVSGSTVHFEFKGKSGQHHAVDFRDKRLAKLVKQCRDIPGQQLFQYYDEEGEHQSIDSADVNDYLREISGEDFTAKDFRTWGGTVAAVEALYEAEPVTDEKAAHHTIVQAVKAVAEHLGNTAAVCRKHYISPVVLDAYKDGSLAEVYKRQKQHHNGLHAAENTVIALLKDATA